MFPVLLARGLSEAEFYDAIVKHGPGTLSSEQWFELLCRYPNRILWSQLDLGKILNREQVDKLPTI